MQRDVMQRRIAFGCKMQRNAAQRSAAQRSAAQRSAEQTAGAHANANANADATANAKEMKYNSLNTFVKRLNRVNGQT